ncbi:MAG TPA: ATP-binding domain-containing protein [Mycobacteriales bacterium]|nr:ATP-binding domain-containing protein [Mycobacteriales bacterium]
MAAESLDGPVGGAARQAELAREQDYLTRLYERLDLLRDQTRARLAEVRRRGATGTPQNRSERDAFATMYEDRLAQLNAVESGLAFGRLDMTGGDRHHIGRIGLTDDRHDTLLVDWRAPVAEPFYRATATDPQGVVRRRHLRTRGRRLLDVEDDVFDLESMSEAELATLGGEGALLAALSARRTGRMRDIVETIQAEQDRVIRAELDGVLVVQGGPGTGKTAVALHRAAYLLYSHRDTLSRTGVLVLGPSPVFLRYIEQVLPSLGETGVVLATLETLVPGVTVTAEDSPAAAEVKADAAMAERIASVVASYQRIPDAPLVVPWDEHELTLTPEQVARARSRARRSGKRHNRARYAFAKQLLRMLVRQIGERDPELAGKKWVVRALMRSDEFRDVVNALWPLVGAAELVETMYADARGPIRRDRGAGWTAADVPVLDEAWALLGDPGEMLEIAARRRQQREDVQYAREVLSATGLTGRVDAATLAARYAAASNSESVASRAGRDAAWQYGHVIVDEAQELSPMAWRMLLRRCPTRSMTVVGDIAQTSATWGAPSWAAVFDGLAPGRWRSVELTVNYRTPAEVMAVAADVLREVDPGATAPASVRETGVPPRAVPVDRGLLAKAVAEVAETELESAAGGTVGVLAPDELVDEVRAAVAERLPDATSGEPLETPVSVLTVTAAKGLEFDNVVLVEPATIAAAGRNGLRDLYVALTRPTQRLTVVHAAPLPPPLAALSKP